jgi:eukaryotic-like serine/threonine-protein kinase
MRETEQEDISEELIDQLVKLDTREIDLLADPAASTLSDKILEEDLTNAANCLNLIHRVRSHSPFCISDLGSEVPIASWSEGPKELPSQIGTFKILRRLGDGGFGVVFLAWDPRLEREVAIKLPRVETLISAKTRERFLRELKTAGRFNHPNIATVYEAGALGPVLYIVSQYYPGGSVDDLIAGQSSPNPQTLTPQQAAHIVANISDAAHHAHEQGILHRDIKPSNILLDAPEGDATKLLEDPAELGRRTRLVDFGLAKDLESQATPTRTGIILGTPAYTAPELLSPKATPSRASDVYSLGATLFHLITGSPPLKRETSFETLVANQREEPPAPSRVKPGIPKDLDAICLKCLEKEPHRRYATAAELASDLRAFLEGGHVKARRASRMERAFRWYRRNTLVAALIMSTATLFIIFAAWLLYTAQLIRMQNEISRSLQERIEQYERADRSRSN